MTCAGHVSAEPSSTKGQGPLCSSFFHYAWGGRLCLHPFNLGFSRALLRDNKIPNLKEWHYDGNEGLIQNRDLCSCAKRSSQIAI